MYEYKKHQYLEKETFKPVASLLNQGIENAIERMDEDKEAVITLKLSLSGYDVGDREETWSYDRALNVFSKASCTVDLKIKQIKEEAALNDFIIGKRQDEIIIQEMNDNQISVFDMEAGNEKG